MPYSRNNDVKTTLMPDGHVVLFNTTTEWAHVVNPTGALVWEFCDGQTSALEMVDEITNLLDSRAGAGLREEVNALINELLGLGLIQEIALSEPLKPQGA